MGVLGKALPGCCILRNFLETKIMSIISKQKPKEKNAGGAYSFLLSLLLVFMFSGQSVKAQPVAPKSSEKSFINITYKKNIADSALTLDIFLPDSGATKKYPVVIIIHGGGWVLGDKTLETIYYMQCLKTELLANRFAVISINYSLVGENIHLPAPVEDCKDAIRWVRAHANDYNLDTLNIGLWGGSAGGHLALLAAYTTNEQFPGDKELASHSARVNYVIDNFGPTELNSLFRMDAGCFSTFLVKVFIRKLNDIREKLVFAMTGFHIKKDKQKIKEINARNSPLGYISVNAVPTIIFHGDNDKVVPISQSRTLKQDLDKYSIKNEMIIVNKGDHGFNNIPNDEIDKLVAQSISFIKAQLR